MYRAREACERTKRESATRHVVAVFMIGIATIALKLFVGWFADYDCLSPYTGAVGELIVVQRGVPLPTCPLPTYAVT